MKNECIYKTVDLFGNETINFIKRKTGLKTLFDDYDGFLDKFEAKKTTDDCYTPKEVMDIIINYVNDKYPLKDMQIIRPFFPCGDFESIEYPSNAAVIDNPPFSIISKICRYYIERGIKFFLFCPHLTAFSINVEATHIIASADITYENGATIKTAFITNMLGDFKIIGDAELHKKFKALQAKNKTNLPKYIYPDNIIMVSKIAYCVERGIDIMLHKNELMHYSCMDAQKKHKKAMFGSGFLASNKAAAKAEAAKAEAAKAENIIAWELSERELKLISDIDNNYKLI